MASAKGGQNVEKDLLCARMGRISVAGELNECGEYSNLLRSHVKTNQHGSVAKRIAKHASG